MEEEDDTSSISTTPFDKKNATQDPSTEQGTHLIGDFINTKKNQSTPPTKTNKTNSTNPADGLDTDDCEEDNSD
eukprot:CAMPEP_0178934946 /NCGR_PEP_ID=MMETSP0786-20121207/24204_1 /TAXON_ID=186022 /ORGANISM="Thalassionema frauenfeldii, Strain CCMP 1798" /LENGTH=73 /DNA_ID=CAMNT_0020612903 /DNA_START=558 /DNA_END=779 /DNA_ORIENTATION=+